MSFLLTKIVASNIDGKVTRKITTEPILEVDYMSAVKAVEKKYIKPLGKLSKRSISEGYSVWESRIEYEPGKYVGIRYKLESEEEEDKENVSSLELAIRWGLIDNKD